MMRKHIRLGTIVVILAVAGWIMGILAEEGNTIGFTATLLIATILVATVSTILGPQEGADERAVRRSEEAAYAAVRLTMIFGLISAAYANMHGLREAAILGIGMAIPGLLWVLFYFLLNWRDTH